MTSYLTPEEIAEWALEATEKEIDFLQNIITVRKTEFRENRAALNLHTLYVGDRVKVREGVRPKKIIGKTGTILKMNEDRILVEFDFPPDDAWEKGNMTPASLERI